MPIVKQAFWAAIFTITSLVSYAENYESLDKYILEIMSGLEELTLRQELKYLYKNYKSSELIGELNKLVKRHEGKLVIDFIHPPRKTLGYYLIARMSDIRLRS